MGNNKYSTIWQFYIFWLEWAELYVFGTSCNIVTTITNLLFKKETIFHKTRTYA